MKNRKNEKGAMIVLVALAMPVLLGGVGLVMDNGAMFDLKRRAQSAADAAALAAANEIRVQNDSGLKTAAVHDAGLNGFTHGGDTAVIVNQPPATGPNAGDNRFVEVIVRERAPRLFMAALTDTRHDIQARAVAGVVAANNCTWTLNKTDRYSFDITGTSNVVFNDCGLHVNSNHAEAARAAGGGQLTAQSVDVAGGYTGAGFTPTPRTDAFQIDDPFEEMQPPVFGSHCDHTRLRINSDTTLNPGIYCGGIATSSDPEVELNPGVYIIMGGGMDIGSQTIFKGEGVSFYLTEKPGYNYDAVRINAQALVSLTAPEDGPMQGMLFFQDRDITSTRTNVLNGGADVSLKGAMYFPTTDVHLAGSFVGEGNKLLLAANNIEVNGNVEFQKFHIDFLPNTLAQARIVE
jgi:hypothetical protein